MSGRASREAAVLREVRRDAALVYTVSTGTSKAKGLYLSARARNGHTSLLFLLMDEDPSLDRRWMKYSSSPQGLMLAARVTCMIFTPPLRPPNRRMFFPDDAMEMPMPRPMDFSYDLESWDGDEGSDNMMWCSGGVPGIESPKGKVCCPIGCVNRRTRLLIRTEGAGTLSYPWTLDRSIFGAVWVSESLIRSCFIQQIVSLLVSPHI